MMGEECRDSSEARSRGNKGQVEPKRVEEDEYLPYLG